MIESGNAALARGDLDEALADFDSALDAQPESARARERRAATFLQVKKFDQAMNDCNEALKIDGKFASAYFTRGLAEKDLGDTEKALEDFTKAVDNGLERVDVLTARGALYHSLAKARASLNPDEAAKDLEKALGISTGPSSSTPATWDRASKRATIHLDMDNYESAVADCDVALEADPNLAAAHVVRARGECELSEFAKAVTRLRFGHPPGRTIDRGLCRSRQGPAGADRRRCGPSPRSPTAVRRWPTAGRRWSCRRK